jgi:hypothetical protein
MRVPAAAPALQQLVARFVESSQPDRFLFSEAMEGAGLWGAFYFLVSAITARVR